MSIASLCDYISSFEQENQPTFLLVRRSIEEIEKVCSKINRKEKSIVTFSSANSKNPTVRFQSWPGACNLPKKKVLAPESGNSAELPLNACSINESLDTSIESKIPIKQMPLRPLPSISARPISHSKKGRDFKPVTFCEDITRKEIIEIGKEMSDSPTTKTKKQRAPFFTLNIKTRLRDTTKSTEKDVGPSAREHSPIFRRKTFYSSTKLPPNSSTGSPGGLSLGSGTSIEERYHERLFISPKMLSHLDLDDNILGEDFLKNIKRIEKNYSSRREIFHQIMEYVFISKNLHEDAHKNYPRKEVIYCRTTNARELLKNLNNLIKTLNTEDVSIQMKIVNEKQCIETYFERYLKNLGVATNFINSVKQKMAADEVEIRTIYEKMVKISSQLNSKSKSKEVLRKNLNYLQKLLEKFPPVYLNSNDRAPIDSEVDIKFITVRKFVEKATEVVDTLMAEKLKQLMILTYDHFLKPLSLLLLLTKRYYTPRPFGMTNQEYNLFKEHHSNTRRKRIIELLAFWVDARSNDFNSNSDLLGLLVVFLESICKYEKEDACKKDFQDLYAEVEKLIEKSTQSVKKDLIRPSDLQVTRAQTQPNPSPRFSVMRPVKDASDKFLDIKTKCEVTEKTEDNIPPLENTNEDLRPNLESVLTCTNKFNSVRKSKFHSVRKSKFFDFNDGNLILCWEAQEIAQQLTLIDSKFFQKIQISHLILKRWMKSSYSEECKKLQEAICRFNSLSFWIQYVITNPSDSHKCKALLNKFILIAAECLKIRNYSSSHSIFSGLLRLQNTKIWSIDKDNVDHWKLLQKTFQSPTFFQDMETILKSLVLPAVPSIPFFTNRFFRLQDNVNFLIKLESRGKYLKSGQLMQLAEYAQLLKKFQSKYFTFTKIGPMYAFLKKEYKIKVDIDFENDEAEEILRKRIIAITSESAL